MKTIAIASLVVAGLIGAEAQATTYTDYARVRSVDPQYENVSIPRNECRSQWVNEPAPVARRDGRDYGGVVLGGVAGGVLGNQIGKGHGREAATAVGAVIGALAGDYFGNQGQRSQHYEHSQREVQSCKTVYDTAARITGYRVSYEYMGQQYQTTMQNSPGQHLPVRVSVEPLGR